jgi:hypothetical protein
MELRRTLIQNSKFAMLCPPPSREVVRRESERTADRAEAPAAATKYQ